MDTYREIEMLRYLLEQISVIESYTKGLGEDEFLRHDMVKDATLMRLMVLGEYSAHINDELKDRFSDIQWQLIKAARNYYAHVYRGVDWLMVWEVVKTELPTLKIKLEHIILILGEENNGKIN